MFTLQNVRYGNILNIDYLVLPPDKVTCIIGESGSGKTTLLRLLNNLISCDEGNIVYMDKNINDIDPVELRRRVVMLSQIPVIFGGNVRDNLLMGLKFSEKPVASKEKLDEVMMLVSLKKNLEDDASRLSGGEKQRLALARVLLMEPEVLLLDEPSSALDDDTEKIVIQNTVNYVKENGKALIMVTHSREIARVYAENIIEISSGRLKNKECR